MQTGKLTVTGAGTTEILLSGRPRETNVVFSSEVDPVPCNPHHGHDHDHDHHGHSSDHDHDHDHDHDGRDQVSYKIDHEDEDQKEHRKPGHHHHDRQFTLEIKWKVSGVREISWFVKY